MQLLERRDFPVATARLSEASGLFRRAESEARAEQARRAESSGRAEQPPPRPAAQDETRAPATPPAPGGAAAIAPAPRRDPLPTTPDTGGAVPAEPAVRDVLARYVAALEARSLPSLKRIWPGLSGPQERAIRDEFENARSIAVELRQPVIDTTGGGAVVTCLRKYELETLDGHHLVSNTTSTLVLHKNGGTWVIDSVRHDVLR